MNAENQGCEVNQSSTLENHIADLKRANEKIIKFISEDGGSLISRLSNLARKISPSEFEKHLGSTGASLSSANKPSPTPDREGLAGSLVDVSEATRRAPDLLLSEVYTPILTIIQYLERHI